MQTELNKFMRKVFHEYSDILLKQNLELFELKSIELATKIQRKQIARNIRSAFPFQSLTKANMLYAELLDILNLEIMDFEGGKFRLLGSDRIYDEDGSQIKTEEADFHSGKNYFATKEEYLQFKLEKQKRIVGEFWNRVDTSLTKFEVIFNLFWLRAGEAEIRGMKHEDVMKITDKAFIGIKNDLEDAFLKIKREFGIMHVHKEYAEQKFKIKDIMIMPEIKDKLEKMKVRYEGEDEIIIAIEHFWNQVNTLYDKFRELFMISMNLEIEMVKNNMDDKELIERTEKEIGVIWHAITDSYSMLHDKISIIQRGVEEDVKERLKQGFLSDQ